MTLNHSKTWPVGTLAVVQFRVDPQGRTYSALPANPEAADYYPSLSGNRHEVDKAKGDEGAEDEADVLPLSKRRLELFTRMAGPAIRTAIRTDTVSTILEQDTEYDFQHQDEPGKCEPVKEEPPATEAHQNGLNPPDLLQKFHVLALTRIEENARGDGDADAADEDDEGRRRRHGVGRRPSARADNWDFIYAEARAPPPTRCPVHRCLNEPAGGGDVPKAAADIPLDARKTTTLRRHYYPEGGWGWVIVVCSVLVHVLNHGVQLAYSQLVRTGSEKFHVEKVHFAGESQF